MNLAEIVREILYEHQLGPERPTPASLARYLLPEADRYLDRVRFDALATSATPSSSGRTGRSW